MSLESLDGVGGEEKREGDGEDSMNLCFDGFKGIEFVGLKKLLQTFYF